MSAGAGAVLMELVPPSGVEYACFASLTGPGDENLVVARRKAIDIYSIAPRGVRAPPPLPSLTTPSPTTQFIHPIATHSLCAGLGGGNA
jgi:hypothetical protein